MHERLQLNNLSFMFTEENVSSATLTQVKQAHPQVTMVF